MRVECSNRNFEPVTIILETQEEVNELYAVSNHLAITGALPQVHTLHGGLKPYLVDHEDANGRLQDALKR